MRLEDMRGQRFGRYEIVDVLGRGGMAAVYRARDTSLQRDVALKLLYAQYSGDIMLLERFRREAILAAQLDHPSIVPIYDVGESNGVTYIAMKLMPGQSLADVLSARGRLPFDELQPVLTQIASALDYAHGRGIIHRDIKPANILLTDGILNNNTVNAAQALTAQTVAMLSDFGIAKSLDSPGMTSTSVMIGTPDYMAPEQIRSDHTIDRRADIYALAALAYRALTGQRLYDGNTQEVLLGHLNGSYTPASRVNPALPRALDSVFARGLALQPVDRYATAGEFVRDLARAWRQPQPDAQQAPALIANQGQSVADATVRGNVRPPGAQLPRQAGAATSAAIQAKQRRGNALLLLGLGLVSVLVLGFVLMKINAMSQQVRPTDSVLLPSATFEATLPAETTTLPTTNVPTATQTSTSAPTNTIAASLTSTSAASATPAPTLRPTQPRPTAPPATIVPVPTSIPSATSIPASPPPSSTPVPPSATAIPATELPPSATPVPTACPISSEGGFAMLLEQNAALRERLGCPRETVQGGRATAVEQKFQGGSMFYFDPFQLIYVLVGTDSGSWRSFEQAALEGQPTPTPAPAPGEGLYVPVRGFGLVWSYYADVREQLGYGVEPEAGPFDGARQRFAGGTLLYSQRGLGRGKTLYALYNDGSFEHFRDPNQ